MAPRKEGRAKKNRKKRQVYFESTYLREVLGQVNDVALELQRTASFNKPISESDTFVAERVDCQPEIDATEAPEPQQNPSRRFKRYWASLTLAQKEAMRRVYVKNPDKLTKVEIARSLGIRVDTLQERLDYAVKLKSQNMLCSCQRSEM